MGTNQPTNNRRIKNWMRKIGITGFLFFLVKGVAWLAITYLVIK